MTIVQYTLIKCNPYICDNYVLTKHDTRYIINLKQYQKSVRWLLSKQSDSNWPKRSTQKATIGLMSVSRLFYYVEVLGGYMTKDTTLFYQQKDVCRMLSISRQTYYAWIKSGHLPSIRIGGQI